ncbi:MAG: ATP-binding protein [Bacteroidia bacterium]
MENDCSTHKELENQIAELKKQNEILRSYSSNLKGEERDHYYSNILNSMGDPVFVKDEQSRLLNVNDAFCKLFGLSRVDIMGKTLAEDVSPEERESFLKIDKQVLNDGIENINEESLTVRLGESKMISTRKSRFIDSEGNAFLVGIIRDITQQYKAEKALKESEALLKELNATKDKLFSVIAHDLRNPIHHILGFSELLIKKVRNFGDEESETYLSFINSSANNTYILLENLLSWAKSETNQIYFKPEKIIFSEIILEIIKLEKSLANTKNISLDYFSIEEIEVYADANILNTILRNLISNAIKFTGYGGHIRVFAITKQDHVEITISDDGIGMNKERLKELFTISSNSTTIGTANEKGTGLGLVLCKEFVEKHNGEIWVESEEGKGSDFKFTLPFKKS